MPKRHVFMDLPKDRCTIPKGLPERPIRGSFDFPVKREFRPGKHANRNRWIFLRGEAARSRTEIPCCQSVANLRRSRPDILKAIVAHQELLTKSEPRNP